MIGTVLLAFLAQANAVPAAEQPPSSAQTAPTQVARVRLRLEADESGTIDKCEAESAEAPKDFLDKICPLFLSKTREPLRDKNGVAQRRTWFQPIKFVIED
ncbi:hypothetical protein [Sphingopyxis sp.]|uniref:hypothetical protein n=1 Tax=Sphingopyxis sp. TaxID=1908224 RepID=UPI003D6D944A